MKAVIGLLLMLLGVSHGVETYCDGRQDGAQCYGPLGGTVVLQLMTKASATHKYQLLNKNTVILEGRMNIVLSNKLENRSSFTASNGTFRINKLSRTDGGEYRLITFDSDGTQSEKRALQLSIQAPVSSVLLVPECLSLGEMKVSCSSEGAESPQYSWTLDDHALTHSELLSGNTDTNSITLKQHVSGKLVCSVKNKVSSVSTEVKISTCDLSRLICGVRAAVVILAFIGITVFFAWKQKKNKMAQDSVVRRQIEDQENSVVMVGMRRSSSDL